MSTKIKSIAVVISSTRTPRAGPQIATFVVDTIRARLNSASTTPLTVIDLADWQLPMFDEPGILSQIRDPAQYAHEHTRLWSREISKHDAFVFVSPQYNWGYPAVLKNAIDYLFHEWTGKKAMVVTYGGHGGDKANAQLRQVLQGLRMTVVPTSVELAFPSREHVVKAATGQSLGLDATSDESTWSAERTTIWKAWSELAECPEPTQS